MQPPDAIRRLPIIIGALVTGLLAFTAFAAYSVASASSARMSNPPPILLVLALFGPSEFIAFKLLIRPPLIRQAAAAAQRADPDRTLQSLFVTATIVPAALAEAWGVFGAVALVLTRQWAAIAAPALALAALALLLDARGRFERFKEKATGQRFP